MCISLDPSRHFDALARITAASMVETEFAVGIKACPASFTVASIFLQVIHRPAFAAHLKLGGRNHTTMEEGEKKIRQEDCSEDSVLAGILTLTNRRIAFDKTKGRIMDFTKKFEETVVDAPLGDIEKVWKEGLLMKKICITIRTSDGPKTYKFGVFSNGSWLKSIQQAIQDSKSASS